MTYSARIEWHGNKCCTQINSELHFVLVSMLCHIKILIVKLLTRVAIAALRKRQFLCIPQKQCALLVMKLLVSSSYL